MPFRSEAEQLREQVRRLDEQARELREEKAELERQIRVQDRPRRWLIASIIAVLVMGAIGYSGGALEATRRYSRLQAIRERDQAVDIDQERVIQYECRKANSIASDGLATCESALATRIQLQIALAEAESRRSTTNTPPPSPNPSDCHCLVGDPLCACPFDREHAAHVLEGAESLVRNCIKPRRPVSFHARLMFEPMTGQASSALIDSAGDLDELEQRCVVTILRGLHVHPFQGGGGVQIGKAFSIPEQPLK